MVHGNPSGALLSLDVGDVRIGVALSRSRVIAEPLATIERKSRKFTLDAIETIVSEHNVTECVLGLPLLEGGSEGEQVEKTKAFGRSLQRRLPALIITYYDERFTSSQAREHAGKRLKPGSDKGLIDRLAAAFILQNYLDEISRNERKTDTEGS